MRSAPRRNPSTSRRSLPVGRGFGKRGDRKRSPIKRSPEPHRLAGFTLAEKGEQHCRACGAVATELHHAVPRSLSRIGRDDLRNGLPLCAEHHRRWHAGYPLPRSIFTADEWAFVCELIGPGWLARRYPRDLEERHAA